MIIVAEPGQSLVVGSVVAETYEVTRLLGRGGMGAVWEASHLRLPGKRVAIKVLLADVAADSEALARFRREAEIAIAARPSQHRRGARLQHAAGRARPTWCSSSCEGESLAQRLRARPDAARPRRWC